MWWVLLSPGFSCISLGHFVLPSTVLGCGKTEECTWEYVGGGLPLTSEG
jgi:hypothetical protein